MVFLRRVSREAGACHSQQTVGAVIVMIRLWPSLLPGHGLEYPFLHTKRDALSLVVTALFKLAHTAVGIGDTNEARRL
jgi:hypothetical protein